MNATGPVPEQPPPAPVGEGLLALPPGRMVRLAGRGEVFARRCGEHHPGPPLLLLHGWTVTADINFWGCYGVLAEQHEVIALDHRGHGRSSRPEGRFTLESCADDAAALLDALGCGPVVAVGYSMGGPVAQLLWQRHRRHTAGLVLAATAGSFRVGRGDRVYFGAFDRLAAAARRAPPALAEQAFARARSGRLSRLTLEDWALADMALGDALALLEAGAALGGFSSATWASRIDVPTAVVVTERDTKVAPARQHELAAAIRGAATFSADADHHDIHREPDEVLPALVAACADVVGRARAADGRAEGAELSG
ncbi:MAG: alpha/beta fold hydrolase [Acidimicrobiia bacterium]|nr:alpha/beta fold hydrolase [Acidimicrobiia bacterium]